MFYSTKSPKVPRTGTPPLKNDDDEDEPLHLYRSTGIVMQRNAVLVYGLLPTVNCPQR
jgi:hypothetical protein